MASPITRKSVEAATSEGSGSDTYTLGHYHLTVFAVARNYDESADTVEVILEGSPDRTHWDEITRVENSMLSQDPDSGEFTGSSFATGEFYQHVRARVVTLTDGSGDDLEVDAWVGGGGNAGQGRKATGRNGPVSDL